MFREKQKIKKILPILLVIIGAFFLGFFFEKQLDQIFPPQPPPVEQIRNVSGPQRLIIEKIGVNAFIEHVGLDKQGRMDIPKDVWDVAWYNLGPRPGETGNAVIDGHVDSPTGPAVFYNLSSLKVGDVISVITQDNTKLDFVITQVVIYKFNELPLQEIFGSSDKTNLNLITCDGVFDAVTRNYSDRLVIYSELLN